jgi:hypothetical protein
MSELRFTLGQLLNQLEALGMSPDTPVLIREYDEQHDMTCDIPMQSIHVTITPGSPGEVVLSALNPST